MYCPFCSTEDTKVIDSRLVGEGRQVRRRRQCSICEERFTTYESAELVMPRVIKRDGRRNPFDEDKLRYGMVKALEKRNISMEALENALQRILHQLRITGEREVSTQVLGEAVMSELRQLDPVAYIRFASVYLDFQNVQAFQQEIQRLQVS